MIPTVPSSTQIPSTAPGTEPEFSAETAALFLRKLFAGQDSGYAVLHALPDRSSTFYDLSERDWTTRAAQAAITLRRTQDVYTAVCSQRERPRHGRGGASTVLSVPGLWADIDIWHQGSSRDDLPRSDEDAWQIIDSVPIRPTMTVRSGNGLHVYWLFREPVVITSEADRRKIAGLCVAFLRYLQGRAAESGWHVDAVSDLARVLRIPGTHNRKTKTPKLVTLDMVQGEPRSNPTEWEELLQYEDDPELAKTISHEVGDHNLGADFGAILQGCSWLRHCVQDAATLSEPEWYRAIATAARCKDGRRIAHEISQTHPKYTPEETDRKIEQACLASRAPRCSFIAAHYDGQGVHCRSCANHGQINSLVKIGFPKRQPMAAVSEQAQPEPVQSVVGRLIDHNDIAGIFELAPQIAQLTDGDLAVLKAELKQHFGRSWPTSDFNGKIKAERERLNAERARIEVQSRPEWERDLLRSSTGIPKPNLANAVIALESSPEWAGVLAFNEFSNQVVARTKAPIERCEIDEAWKDEQFSQACVWLQHKDINVATQTAWEAIQTIARKRGFHPVREYLESLRWDGEPRIATWLHKYARVKLNEYSSTVGEKWLISAVARIMDPGCKVDTCLILEGGQGWKKSSTLRALSDPWFSDELGDLSDKDTLQNMQGVWIIEIGELSAFGRSETACIKKFMSKSSDKFRSPYGRTPSDYPRQCVFAGTLNPSGNGYLKDETGNRRFWPVACLGKADLDAIQRDRDQIWAEAVARYRDGVAWYTDDDRLQTIIASEVEDRFELDPWHDTIETWCYTRDARFEPGKGQIPMESRAEWVTVNDVLVHGIGKMPAQQTQTDMTRVARCLVSMGWKRVRKDTGSGRKWVYAK